MSCITDYRLVARRLTEPASRDEQRGLSRARYTSVALRRQRAELSWLSARRYAIFFIGG